MLLLVPAGADFVELYLRGLPAIYRVLVFSRAQCFFLVESIHLFTIHYFISAKN